MRICTICEEEFDPQSPAKRKVGGIISHCVECSEENAVKYVGLSAADGKQAQATILKFESEEDKKKYVAFWQNNSGLHRGKVCSLGRHLSTDPGVKFKTVVAHNPTNSKGRANG